MLEVWSLESLRGGGARPVPVAEAQARIARKRREREPWQRMDETVANIEGVEAIESEGGAVLYSRAGERLWLLQAVASDQAAATERSSARFRRRPV